MVVSVTSRSEIIRLADYRERLNTIQREAIPEDPYQIGFLASECRQAARELRSGRWAAAEQDEAWALAREFSHTAETVESTMALN